MADGTTYPVPDGTTWDDAQGNEWTSHGADVELYEPPGWNAVAFRIEVETSTPGTWLDITDDYVSASWSGSTRQRWGTRFLPGGATVTIKNPHYLGWHGYYHPSWGSADRLLWKSQPIRITAIHGTFETQMFQGTVRQIVAPTIHGGPDIVTVHAQTPLAVAGRGARTAVTAVGAGELAGARIGRILDSMSWPSGDRDLDTGYTGRTLQATTLAGSAATELEVTAASDGGEVFEDPNGQIVFRDWGTLSVAKDADPKIVLLRDPSIVTGFPPWWSAPVVGAFAEALCDDDLATIVNHATITRVGGTPQVNEHVGSQGIHGMAPFSRSDLINEYDSWPDSYGFRLVDRTNAPWPQHTSVTVASGDSYVVDVMLNLSPLDIIYTYDFPVTGRTEVEGIRHTIRPARSDDHPEGRTDIWTVALNIDKTYVL